MPAWCCSPGVIARQRALSSCGCDDAQKVKSAIVRVMCPCIVPRPRVALCCADQCESSRDDLVGRSRRVVWGGRTCSDVLGVLPALLLDGSARNDSMRSPSSGRRSRSPLVRTARAPAHATEYFSGAARRLHGWTMLGLTPLFRAVAVAKVVVSRPWDKSKAASWRPWRHPHSVVVVVTVLGSVISSWLGLCRGRRRKHASSIGLASHGAISGVCPVAPQLPL